VNLAGVQDIGKVPVPQELMGITGIPMTVEFVSVLKGYFLV
jgi:hypothetical protein